MCARIVGLGERRGRAVYGTVLPQHVPDDGQVGAQDASEGFEDRVCAERDVVPSEVWASASEYNRQSDRRDDASSARVLVLAGKSKSRNLRKTEAEDETEEQLLLGLQLKVPYHGHRHQEDPDVRDQVRDVGEVGECDHGEALASDVCIPVRVERPTSQEQCDSDTNAPGYHEQGSRENDGAKHGVHEDTVVEGEDTELDKDQGEVVEVAEDVVALAHHHLIVGRHDNDMAAHAVGRACWWLATARYR